MATTSYGSSNQRVDYWHIFQMLQEYKPTFLSLCKTALPETNPLTGSNIATKRMHEWYTYATQRVASTVASGATAGGTTFTITSATGFSEGDVINFLDGNSESFVVTDITGSVFTLHDTIGTTHADGTIVIRLGTPQQEGVTPTALSISQATKLYNYTQIFERTVEITGSANAEVQPLKETSDGLLQYGEKQKLTECYADMARTALGGVRIAPSGSAIGSRGSMGGLLWWLKQASAIKTDISAAALTSTLLDNTLEDVYQKGGAPDTILCSIAKSRTITAFNATNEFKITMQDSSVVGYQRNQVQPGITGAKPLTIFIDPNMSDYEVALVDSSKLYFLPFSDRALHGKDLPQTSDSIKRMILGEYTFHIDDPYNSHALIYNTA